MRTSVTENWYAKNYSFVLFILTAIFLRFFSFFPSVLDHDESTYLIIGRDILQGKLLYTDITDTKPIGIFLIYGMFHFLFGYSIFLQRLAVSVIVGLTAHLISKFSMKLFSNQRAAMASGFIYLFYTCIWTYHGLSPNAELIFNLSTVCALLLLQRSTRFHFFSRRFGNGNWFYDQIPGSI